MKKNFYWKLLALPCVQWIDGEIEVDVREDPSVHICKLTNGVCIWAQPPNYVIDVCTRHLHEIVADDDRGQEYTGEQLMKYLNGMYEDGTRIGQRFS